METEPIAPNAIEASRRGERVNISVDYADNHKVIIWIRDRGHGIAAEIRDELFAPFCLTGAANSARPGLGLGLAIVKGIVKSLDGGLDFQCTAGEGSSFRVSLPPRPAEANRTDWVRPRDATVFRPETTRISRWYSRF